MDAKPFTLWNLTRLPLMWILLHRLHNRLEFPWNSTGSWKSLRDSNSFPRTYWVYHIVSMFLLLNSPYRTILGFLIREEPDVKDTDLYTALLHLRHPWRAREVKLDRAASRIDVWIEHAEGTQFLCPECRKVAPIYDHADEREWRHLDTCDCKTYVHARLPRVNCPRHGVRQIIPSWSGTDTSGHTLQFEALVIDTLKECDVSGTTRLTHTGWSETWGVLERAVARGFARKERRIPRLMSVDEKAFAKRHRYETLICDQELGTVEHVVDGRRQESLEAYYQQFTNEELSGVEAVAMDMWDPYIAATKACVPYAESKIVFDKFHVVRTVTLAVDRVRRQEHKVLKAKGDERLKGTKHLWLANKENVPDWRKEEFEGIRGANLKTGRAWAMKESLRKFWKYHYPKRAEAYFRRWYYWVTHSRLTPMIKAAKTLKAHLANIMTYFRHRISNAVAEGLNSKIQMVKEMACGFRNREHYKKAIYFHCGGLDLYPRSTT